MIPSQGLQLPVLDQVHVLSFSLAATAAGEPLVLGVDLGGDAS